MPKSVNFQFHSPHNHRCKYLEHLNLSGLDEHSTPADYNDLLHSAEVEPLIWMLMLSKTICGGPGEGALPQLDRGRLEKVAQPGQPQPRHPGQQRHPQDCQQNLPKVLVAIKCQSDFFSLTSTKTKAKLSWHWLRLLCWWIEEWLWRLKELRLRGPSHVTDLGIRWLAPNVTKNVICNRRHMATTV